MTSVQAEAERSGIAHSADYRGLLVANEFRATVTQIAHTLSGVEGTTASVAPAGFAGLRAEGTSTLLINSDGTWTAVSTGGGGSAQTLSALVPPINVGTGS